jgi:hypothetical protein
MRKTPLQDRERLRLQAGVVMNLGLLAVEAGIRWEKHGRGSSVC